MNGPTLLLAFLLSFLAFSPGATASHILADKRVDAKESTFKSEVFVARVTRVIDAQTLALEVPNSPQPHITLHLYGITIPRDVDGRNVEADILSGYLAEGRRIMVVTQSPTVENVLWGQVLLPEGVDLGGELVRSGYACFDRNADPIPAGYILRQEEAQKEKAGIWKAPSR